MVVNTVQKEKDVYENIHVDLEGGDVSLFIGDTHLFFERKTFERLLFTMQTALLEEEMLGKQNG